MPTVEHVDAPLYWEQLGEGVPTLLIPAPPSARTCGGLSRTRSRRRGRVIVYERRGFNRSMGRPVRHMRHHADDAAALLSHLWAAPAHILGWSGGGLVALALAVEHPRAVRSLTLLEPSLHMVKNVSRSLLPTVVRGTYLRLLRRDDIAVDLLYRRVFSYSTGGSAYDRFPDEWRAELRRNAAAVNQEARQEAAFYPSWKAIAAIDVPITCVVGELSAYRKSLARVGQAAPEDAHLTRPRCLARRPP